MHPAGLRAEGRQRVRRQNSSGRPLSQSASVGHWKFLSPWTVSLLPEQARQSWTTCWGGVGTPDRGRTWTKAETPAGAEMPSLAHGAGALEWVVALFPGVRNAQSPNDMLSTQGEGVLCLPFAIRRVQCSSGTHPLPSSSEHRFKVKKENFEYRPSRPTSHKANSQVDGTANFPSLRTTTHDLAFLALHTGTCWFLD